MKEVTWDTTVTPDRTILHYSIRVMNASHTYLVKSYNNMITMQTPLHPQVTLEPGQSNTTVNSSHNPDKDLPYNAQGLNIMVRYYIWAILVLGFPGNLFSFITIMKMSRLKSSTFYVAALASVDNIALILKSTFMELRYHPHAFSSAGCKTICFFGLMTAAYSNWILVAMASERFMAVRFPLKVASMWTLKRAVILSLIVFIVLSIIHLHIFWTMENSVYGCVYTPAYTHFTDTYWYWISASLYAFIPCTVLIVLNFLIVQRIQQSSKRRRQLIFERNCVPPSTSSLKPKRPASVSHDNHITMMLVSVTIVFVILTIPRCAVLLIIHTFGQSQNDATHQLLDVITSFFADSSHAVNFFLYFFAARQFRYHFLMLFLGQRQPTTYTTARTSTWMKGDEKETSETEL